MVKLDDWLTILRRASLWNDWSQEEQLQRFAGHLRDCAVQEWDLLGKGDRATFEMFYVMLKNMGRPGYEAN